MKIYITQRNSGWGPMINDKAFLNKMDAKKYIDSKPGVIGIKEINVLEGPYNEVEDKKMKALEKLTEEEKQLLGLSAALVSLKI